MAERGVTVSGDIENDVPYYYCSSKKKMPNNSPVSTELVFAEPLPTNNGYSWTLASRLGSMLQQNQDLYGERDNSFTILGVEFCGDIPQLWYPGNCGNIIVQLTRDVSTDPVRACYQLAHESVHLLSPSGGRRANNLEEGLAVLFSNIYLSSNFGRTIPPNIQSYEAAVEAVEELLGPDPNVIKKLRQDEPRMFEFTQELIERHAPHLSSECAGFLATKFNR